MDILFDIKKQEGGNRHFKYTLICQSHWTIKGKKLPHNTIFIDNLNASLVNSIFEDYAKDHKLNDKNVRVLNFELSRRKTSIEQLNKEVEILF